MTIEERYRAYLKARYAQNILRTQPKIDDVQGIYLARKGKSYINFSSNDNLGFSQHPKLIETGNQWARKWGAGSGASRLVTGQNKAYRQVEKDLAIFTGKPAALVMASGFQCNLSLGQALFNPEVLKEKAWVFFDKGNHASMYAGCQLADIHQKRYRHLDYDHLERLLEKTKNQSGPKFIWTETVFSMDGDCADLARLVALKKRYKAFLIVDEAHATGILGPKGRGLAYTLRNDIDVVMSTCSKAMGSFGAFVAGPPWLMTYLLNSALGLIYSTALPPSVWGSIAASLELLPCYDDKRDYVLKNAHHLRQYCQSLGLDVGTGATHIIPLILKDSQRTLFWSDFLKKKGFWVSAIRPPTVAPKTSRLRISMSALHTQNHLESLKEAIATLVRLERVGQ